MTIDIQKKKYCRGKRRIKGSTYKRQQWKKKSQFSKQNTSNGYQYKKSGHWVNEYNNGSKGNQRYYFFNFHLAIIAFVQITMSFLFATINNYFVQDQSCFVLCFIITLHFLYSKMHHYLN